MCPAGWGYVNGSDPDCEACTDGYKPMIGNLPCLPCPDPNRVIVANASVTPDECGESRNSSFHALFLIAWLADGDSLMCYIVTMGRQIAKMFSTFSL